ncbi:MAG: FAD-binding oxidoreductase [Burkholderiales bacterium]
MTAQLAELPNKFVAIVGADNVLTTDDDVAGYSRDWRKKYVGRPLAVVKPKTTAEVAAVVKLCAEAGAPIVPQGGNTGLVGGATPDASGTQVIINLSRMNRIRAIDTQNNTIVVEAGCVLANLQQAARDANRFFPLSLASEGSCEIGGNLSTNAGGTAVLRYGNTRELVLGLEVVLPSGEVWDGLRGLRKDNTGYDLKHLFIGAEGTLGVVTAAVVKLFPQPLARAVSVVGLANPRRSVELLGHMQSRCGERLTGFELFSERCLSVVLQFFPGSIDPLAQRCPYYALLELSDTHDADGIRGAMEGALADALESEMIRDAAIATSEGQAKALWSLRENVSEAQAHEGKNIKHDVSIPASKIAEFIEVTDELLAKAFPGLRMYTFGHVGDGNLHYNVAAPTGVDPEVWVKHQDAVNLIVHDSTARFGGSISAEHGLGQLKRDEILRYKAPIEIDLMRRIKAAIDPQGLMNPGKVL